MPLSDKVILITGAAGRIGAEVSRQCIDSGATVVLSDTNESIVKEKFSTYHDLLNKRIYIIEQDITLNGASDDLLQKADLLAKRITSVVHCAYPVSPGWGLPLDQLQAHNLYEDLNKQLGIPILLSTAVLNYFAEKGGGDLVHISSIQGIRAPKFEHYDGTDMTSPVEYSAIKSGLISMCAWFAKYYKNKNIRVNCVSPGGILDGQDPSFLQRYRSSCTNIGMLTSSDVAKAVLFLLSSDSYAINGQNVVVDDGWSL